MILKIEALKKYFTAFYFQSISFLFSEVKEKRVTLFKSSVYEKTISFNIHNSGIFGDSSGFANYRKGN